MIFADRISQLTRHDGLLNKLLDGSRMVAIHDDVVAEAMRLVKASDEKKMREVSKYTCWPDYDTWLECVIDDADVGVYFHGEGRSVTQGYAMIIIDFRREDDDLDFIPIALNLETYDVKFCDLQKVARMRAERMGIDNEIRAMFQLIEPSSSVSTDPLVQHAVMQPFMTWFKPLLLALLAFTISRSRRGWVTGRSVPSISSGPIFGSSCIRATRTCRSFWCHHIIAAIRNSECGTPATRSIASTPDGWNKFWMSRLRRLMEKLVDHRHGLV